MPETAEKASEFGRLTVPEPLTRADQISREPHRVYRWNNLTVTPHVSPNDLAHAYLRFQEEGTLEAIFHEGVPNIQGFLELHKQIPFLGCYIEHGTKLIGLGWAAGYVVNGEHKRAEFIEAFFRGYGYDMLLACGMMMTAWAFEQLGLSVAIGTTPEPNRAAVLYFKKLGFESFGPIPDYTLYDGKPCGIFISVMTRDRWREQFGLVEPEVGGANGIPQGA